MALIGRRRPRVARTVARTALVAGTAQASANAVNRRAQERSQGTPQGSSPGPAAGNGSELVEQLAELARLRESGALTPEEFQAAKGKLLA